MDKGKLDATLDKVSNEVIRARGLFPSNRRLLAALMEEVGELAQACLEDRPLADIQGEAIQVAAVAIRIFEEGDPSFPMSVPPKGDTENDL